MSLRSTLILSSHICVSPPSSPSGFPTKTFYAFLFPTHATCCAHLILLDVIIWILLDVEYKSWRVITQFGEQCKPWSGSLYSMVSSTFHEVLHHTGWWAVRIMRCLIIQFGEQCKLQSVSSYNLNNVNHELPHKNLVSSANHEVPHTIWWAVQIMCLIIQFGEQCQSWSASVCFSLLLHPLSFSKYFPTV